MKITIEIDESYNLVECGYLLDYLIKNNPVILYGIVHDESSDNNEKKCCCDSCSCSDPKEV